MAISRYRNTNVIDKKYFETVDFPQIDVTKISTFSIRITDGDRLDNLAFKYLGSGEYWWVIALINDIDWSFDFISGQIIQIPTDAEEVLKFF